MIWYNQELTFDFSQIPTPHRQIPKPLLYKILICIIPHLIPPLNMPILLLIPKDQSRYIVLLHGENLLH